MKNSKIFMGLIGLIVLYGVFAMLPFGCSQLPDTGGSNWMEGGNSATGYAVSGILYQMDGVTPVRGATCVLQQQSTKDSSSTGVYYNSTVVTDSSGFFNFVSVPIGTYVMTVTGTGLVKQTYNFNVTGTVTQNFTTLTTSDWTTFMGSTSYPYDPNSGYITVVTNFNGSALDGVAVNSVPSDYSARGYITTNNVVDYTAQGTYTTGKAFFYKVKPGQAYNFLATKTSYTFTPIVAVTPTAGQIDTYITTGTGGPTQVPTYSPTTQSPSAVPVGGVFSSPAATKRMAMGLVLMLALSCVVLLKKEK